MCSTCHDGLLAAVMGAAPGGSPPGAGLPETRPHSRVVVVRVEYSSKTLAPCLPLCRKCSEPPPGQHIPRCNGQVYGIQVPETLRIPTEQEKRTGKRQFPSMLPLLSSPLVYVFFLHSERCGTGPRLLWRLSVVWEPRVSHDCLSVRALTPVNRFSMCLERHKQRETVHRPACEVTPLDAAGGCDRSYDARAVTRRGVDADAPESLEH